MQPNNKYYKLIAKLLDESIDNRHHTDLYYTKRIAESYGETYIDLGNVNKYLKDFAEDVGVELDGKHHINRWYLKRIADKLYDDELEYDTENYYLRIISESINPTPPTPPTFDGVSLSVDESTIVYGESVTLTAQLTSDGSPFSVEGETVSFYNGATLLGTDDTDSTGVATFTSSNFDVGSHSVTGVCDEYTSNSVSVTVDKLTPSISLSVPTTGTMGSAYTISGTLVPSSGEVKLYEDNTLIDTLSVTGGVFSKSITQNSEGTYSYYVVFEGSSTYNSVTSNTSSIVITKLPVEYQEVEYIENTGTSYIDTGFKPNNNTRTYIMFYAGTLGTNVRAIFGSRDDTTYNHSYTSFYLGSNTTSIGRMRVDYYNANSNNIYLFPNTSDKTEYELDYNKNIVTLNGATHTFTLQTFNSNNNIFLFTCNSGGIADNRMMIGKIYACKIWDNEVLIRDLIPCYRISDNVIGLYDIVNDVFYTNSGTGTFSKGADV